MALPSTGQISMLDIYQEKTGFSSGRRDGDDATFSLAGFSVDGTTVNPGASNNARDFIHDGDINEFRDGTPNSSTPYAMSEFHGWAQSMPYNSLTRSGANNVGDFTRILSSYNGFGALSIQYQIVQMSIDLGSGTYLSGFYLEETAQGSGAYTSNGGSASSMTTGTLYPIHQAQFNSADFPDSYQIDISHAESFGGGGAYSASQTEVAGVGESHTSGASWDNSVFTLMSPSGTNRTAFKEQHTVTGECWTGTYQGIDTITFKYNRSGYPQLVIPSFTINVDATFNHVGMCP